MDILQAVILGIVEGLTEFLPVSSTAHLIITSAILQIPQSEFVKFFEIVIQSAAILSVIFLYRKYIIKHKSLIYKIIISFVPTAIVGLLLHKIIKTVFFESIPLITFALILFGVVFLIIELLIHKKKINLNKSLLDLTYRHAFIIGCFQALAVVPGVSRAGIVIVAMLLLKYKRMDSAIYSFLLAVPTILGASALDIVKVNPSVFYNVTPLLVGGFSAFVSAYVTVKLFTSFLQKHTLIPFALYRIILGIGLIIL